MQAFRFSISALLFVVPFMLQGATDEEVSFEETVIEAEDCKEKHCRHHLRAPYSDEEERFYHEKTESYWPGKREDTLLDEIIHQ